MIDQGHDVGKQFQPTQSFGVRHRLQVLDHLIQKGLKFGGLGAPLLDQPQDRAEIAALRFQDLGESGRDYRWGVGRD